MIEHESDLWPERRWAVQRNDARPGVVALAFSNAAARDAWVKVSPTTRRAVGKRHPAVKAAEKRARALSTEIPR